MSDSPMTIIPNNCAQAIADSEGRQQTQTTLHETVTITISYTNSDEDRFQMTSSFDKVPDQQRMVVKAAQLIEVLYKQVR